jgi:hypothetical protein
MSEHSFKMNFCMFEKSQVKYNNWDCHIFFLIISINCNFYMLKA